MQNVIVIILGHMRSYSTLLSHILGSSDEICGYCETHTYYNRPDFYNTLRQRIEINTSENIAGKYLLDKILHQRYQPHLILKQYKPKLICLLRKPEATIKSIINMGTNIHQWDWHQNPSLVLQYYIKTLQYIQYCITIKQSDLITIFAEDLILKTDNTLRNLSSYLRLSTTLSENYKLFQKTGQYGYGDPSKTILTGKIDRSNNSNNYSINLDKKFLSPALETYENVSKEFYRWDINNVSNNKF